MKLSYLLFIVLLISCKKKPQDSKDVILANINTTTHKSWDNLNSLELNYVDETYIGGKLVGMNKVKKRISEGKFQRTETYLEDKMVDLTITNSDGSTRITFENKKVAGINDIPKENVGYKEELALIENSDNLVLNDTIIDNESFYKLYEAISNKAYLYNKETKLLKYKYETTNYGNSTTIYSDYKFENGYSFPLKIIVDIPASGYKKIYTYNTIKVNPKLSKNEFIVDSSYRLIRKGNEIPAFEVVEYNNPESRISNKNLKSKIVLIDFWATWCAPCIKEFPNLKELHNTYKNKGFIIIGISLDEDGDKLDSFMKRNNIPWVTAHNSKGFKSDIAKSFQVASLPNTVLVDTDGKIIATGIEASGKKLNELLKSLF